MLCLVLAGGPDFAVLLTRVCESARGAGYGWLSALVSQRVPKTRSSSLEMQDTRHVRAYGGNSLIFGYFSKMYSNVDCSVLILQCKYCMQKYRGLIATTRDRITGLVDTVLAYENVYLCSYRQINSRCIFLRQK